MNEFLEQFIIEGRELLEQGSRDLLRLEESPNDRQPLDGAFRAIHTLKGAAGIVEFAPMSRALHIVEDTLAGVRAGKQAVTPLLVTNCLASLDQVSEWLRETESTGDLPAGADSGADKIIALFSSALTAPPPAAQASDDVRAKDMLEAQVLLIREEGAGGRGRVMSALRVAENVLRHIGQTSFADGLRQSDMSASAASAALRLVIDAIGGVEQREATTRTAGSALSLRVDVSRVDALVKLTGELTTAKNAIGHIVDLVKPGADISQIASLLREHHATLDRLVGALQRSILNVSVLPMRQVFQRFPRLVREMSADLDKPARLVMEGEDTEADKAVVEALFDPLLHVIRNALDHGIENKQVREERAKPGIAKIALRALRAGEHVIVEVEDDGGGIDLVRVRALAIERGVGSREAVAAMSDAEAAELVFAPGFSTAHAVTALSGRGVGMDAVRTAIEGVGGRVSLETSLGKRTLVRFHLPFTLMVSRVMVVRAGAQTFGIPFDAVVGTVRAKRADVSAVGLARAFVYRNRTVPVINLATTLGKEGPAEAGDDILLVVAAIGSELAAFEVDRVESSLDVMLSPLEGLMSGVPGIAGVTVLGDGTVLIVLDLYNLLH